MFFKYSHPHNKNDMTFMKNRLFRKNDSQQSAWKLLVTALAIFFLFATQARAEGRRFLHGHVPAVVADQEPAGNLAGASRMNLAIGLPLRNREALTNLLQQIYDPANTNYHHYLTPEQFTARFGPTEQDYRKVMEFAKANGLNVTATYPNRMLVDVSGTVAEVENAFAVTMHVYQHPTEPRTFFAPDMEPSVPSTVPILDINGLDNYRTLRPNLVPRPANTVVPSHGSAPDGSGYMGYDFRAAYAPDVNNTGVGQTLALIEFDGYYPNDIQAYEQLAGLPNVPLQNVLWRGFSGNPVDSLGNCEVSLDIEMVVSMAPYLSKIVVYEAPSDQYSAGYFAGMLNTIAADYTAKQISCSWLFLTGYPYYVDPQLITGVEQIFQELAVQGQSFFQASGDFDAYLNGTPSLPYPADSPHVISVGGTTLTTSGPRGTWQSETVWNWGIPNTTPGVGGAWGSSGGISPTYPFPGWQWGNVNIPASGASSTMRNLPDVAMTADNVYVIYNNGTGTEVGGTSCAAPLWAAFTALANGQAASNGNDPLGFLNPRLYRIGGYASGYSICFHDITTGNNTWSASPDLFYAVPGYDLCTGLGTPKGQALIAWLAGPTAPANLTATPVNSQVTLSWSPSIGATFYNVKRSTTILGTYMTIASPSSTVYTDSIGNGTVYYYKVSAVAGTPGYYTVEGGNSAPVSNIISKPAPPTGLTATPGHAQVSLSWNPSGGAFIYIVARATTSGTIGPVIGTSTSTTYTDYGVANGTTYYYVVSAINMSGQSGYSSQASATPH